MTTSKSLVLYVLFSSFPFFFFPSSSGFWALRKLREPCQPLQRPSGEPTVVWAAAHRSGPRPTSERPC